MTGLQTSKTGVFLNIKQYLSKKTLLFPLKLVRAIQLPVPLCCINHLIIMNNLCDYVHQISQEAQTPHSLLELRSFLLNKCSQRCSKITPLIHTAQWISDEEKKMKKMWWIITIKKTITYMENTLLLFHSHTIATVS